MRRRWRSASTPSRQPYAGVSTAILLFTKTNAGGTDHVSFYDMQADGWSLDDKRNPLLSEDKLGVFPSLDLCPIKRATVPAIATLPCVR
ncbi:MAG: hypothetical protein ACYCZD_15005 [Rhodanobacter sp.]